jgi:hypothetical protein
MEMNEPKTTNRERGFSLVEVMLAALLTIGLLATIFALTSRNQKIYLSESGTTEMNQNVRSVVDLLTRDIQSAGVGLPRVNGSFAAIYYQNGTSGAPDQILIVNGNPYSPSADVESGSISPPEFTCMKPPEISLITSGSGQSLTYKDLTNTDQPIYKQADNKKYLVYDDTCLRVFQLSQDGKITGSGSTERLYLKFASASLQSPAATFGSTVDTAEPVYSNAKLAMLDSLVAYRINTSTHELERSQDLVNWYTVARGIINLQIEYRTIGTDASGDLVEIITPTPTPRRNIRSLAITVLAETPDLDANDEKYRQVIHKFETTPRNFNLLNNSNLSSNTDSTWQF